MYEKHFNFSENPFTIAPNPRYLYLTNQHREALAHLAYGLNEKNGGFILLTGEVGTGKTTVCRTILEQLPEDTCFAMVLNPALSETELLETICDEFGIEYAKGSAVKELIDVLNVWLLRAYAKGKRASVVIEEAQNLDSKVLEQLRLLTNLETNEHKLLQIILIGQPELLGKLKQPELRQLSQRIVARYHLKPLKHSDVRAYIMHRLHKANGATDIFSPAVILRITQLSQGIPRLINLLCDRALLGAYVQGKHQVDMNTLIKASAEVFGAKKLVLPLGRLHTMKHRWLPISAALLAIFTGVAYLSQSALFGKIQNFWTPAEVPAIEQTAMPPRSDIVQFGGEGESIDGVATLRTEVTPLTTGPAENGRALQPPWTWQTLKAEMPSERQAYQSLFASWELDSDYSGTQSPCEFARAQGLDCWDRQGGFLNIQHLNRPVILNLINENEQPFYVALLTTDRAQLQIGVGDKMLEVSKSSIEEVWTGEYTLVWKRPSAYTRTVRPNDRSQLISWLEEQLAKIHGRIASSRKGRLVYNADLVASVRSFQRNCGLQIDGLVGKETIMMLNAVNGKVPVLSASRRNICSRKLNV